jgi:hypothetical protein
MHLISVDNIKCELVQYSISRILGLMIWRIADPGSLGIKGA